MAERDEIAQVVGEANRAMSAGDHAAAERALRRALKLQEDQLGLAHPDVVNTLNDLGVVCDLLGRPREAEFLYRRALGIARRTLEPDHTYIATSLQNLADLYQAQGEPEKIAKLTDDKEPRSGLPTRTTAADATEPVPGPGEATAPPTPVTPPPAESPPAPSPRATGQASTERSGRGVVIVVAGVALLVILWFVFGRGGPEAQSSGPLTTGGGLSTPSQPATPEAGGDSLVTAPDRPDEAGDEATPTEPAESPAAPPPVAPVTPMDVEGPAPAPVEDSPVAVDARICRRLVTLDPSGERLADWQCEAVADPVRPGRIFFYTRIRSPIRTTVEHRWIRDGVLQQEVALEIAPNDGPGYRTYSLHSVSSREQGDWRVELLSADGALLFSDEFAVR